MKLKSFFADTIEEAIRQARQELGPDAMLVNSKRSGAEAQHLGWYEVVVCGEAQETGATGAPYPERANELRTAASRAPSFPVDQLAHDVSEIKQRMEKLALTLARAGRGAASMAFDPELSRAFTTLTDVEIDTELAYDIVGRLSSPISESGLRQELAKLVSVDSELGLPGTRSRAVALVGPPGAGKTSALVKLAVQYGLVLGRTVEVLTTDTFRIAAAEELRSYAAILGIGCQVLETPTALARALAEGSQQQSRPKDLVLIDTPGLCHFELEACQDFAHLLATYPGVDIHLVLPASMRAADLRRVSEQYSIFQPRKLLFTRLDETETFGPLLSRSVRMGMPVSFFSRGQRIPEDLEPATTDLLLDLVLGTLGAEQPQDLRKHDVPDQDVPSKDPPQTRAPKYGVVAA
jgi:flagellar biosynthesis protein FlhF